MSSDRVAATLIGLALVLNFPLCLFIAAFVILLLVYGLFPRRGVRVSSKVVKIASKVVGCSALALSLLLLAGLLIVSAPLSVMVMFLTVFLVPSAALTLYGFEIGVVPRFSTKVAAYIRASIVALVTLALGLGTIIAYVDLILSDVEFLSKIHEVGIEAAKAMLPGWILALCDFALGSFLFALGAIALVCSKRVVEKIKNSPRPAWIPGRSKAGQVFVLAFSALLIGVGPFIYLKSKVFLAGALISFLGAYCTLLIVDQPALKATYKELRAILKLGG
ncbi:hypothetical protein DRN86_04675 [Candidatus Geothermarchaeota archaeon]|nr:MAG: hypothetical protein DRN86_04675 [Candidatus Geothermarchaeota archaeon]